MRNDARATSRLWSALRGAFVLMTLLISAPTVIVAHEIPSRVAIIAYVKPEAHTLHVIVRVPLESMRDMQFPTRPNGTLELAKMGTLLPDAAELWVQNYIEFFENGVKITHGRPTHTRLSLPSDRSFSEYDRALEHVRADMLNAGVPNASAPIAGASSADVLSADTELTPQQAMFDIELEYPIVSDRSNFSVTPALAHLGLRTTTVLRFLSPGRSERVFEYAGNPGNVALDPRWHQAAVQFIQLGFEHILSGFDHLLFIFCLVIPVRRWRSLAAIVTAFTAAHSITLVASAYGFAPDALWFPPLIECLIALSIVYMALENILGKPNRLQQRWMFAFGFGLVHGFGFSFALRESLQFAGSHVVTSLAAFNIGVELGQLFVLALALPVLAFVRRHTINERATVIVASAIVAHSGWHWMTDRFIVLSEYRFTLPTLDAVFLLGTLRLLLLFCIAGTVAWGLSGLLRRLAGEPALKVDTHEGPVRG